MTRRMGERKTRRMIRDTTSKWGEKSGVGVRWLQPHFQFCSDNVGSKYPKLIGLAFEIDFQ